MAAKLKLSITLRIKGLTIALGLFALLYTLTNTYAEKVFIEVQSGHKFSHLPHARVHLLTTTIDSTIPFISSMIVPYSWSIILFCIGFFLVKTQRQLSLLTQRLILATLFACFIFYIFPARFSFERPNVDNWTRFGYQFLMITDKPFNQFPSLHVTYALLIGTTLWQTAKVNNKRLTLFYRLLLSIICSLIIVSTIFTYQHHFLDIVGGFLLTVIILGVLDKLRSYLVLKYLMVAITGFLLLAIVGFLLSLKFSSVVIETLFFILALYWLISFLGVAWIYQRPNQIRNKICFKKDSWGNFELLTWIRFAPLLLGYRFMSYLGQRWNLYQLLKQDRSLTTYDLSSLYSFIKNPQRYHLIRSIYAIATPRLVEPNIEHYMSIIDDNLHSFTSLYKPTCIQKNTYKIIVVDLAVEVPSHFSTLKKFAKRDTETSITLDYIYFPLLDLQCLNEIDNQSLIRLFEQLDELLFTNTVIEGKMNVTSFINFHCVMGFSRSVAIQVLYLVYCGKLTAHNYLPWIAEHYPKARISDDYLPKSVIESMALAYQHKS